MRIICGCGVVVASQTDRHTIDTIFVLIDKASKHVCLMAQSLSPPLKCQVRALKNLPVQNLAWNLQSFPQKEDPRRGEGTSRERLAKCHLPRLDWIFTEIPRNSYSHDVLCCHECLQCEIGKQTWCNKSRSWLLV